jgi:hypothetical protein
MKNFFLFILLALSVSCQKKAKKEPIPKVKENTIDFFEPADLGAFGSGTRLIIYAGFDECGEWGGHEENFEIFSKEDKQFYAKYTRTKVDCEKIGTLYGKPEFQKPYINKEIKLSDKEKLAINEYLSSLIKSKIKEHFPGNSGQSFGAIKTDSTLIIRVYDHNKGNLKNYNKLLTEFNLQKVDIKK